MFVIVEVVVDVVIVLVVDLVVVGVEVLLLLMMLSVDILATMDFPLPETGLPEEVLCILRTFFPFEHHPNIHDAMAYESKSWDDMVRDVAAWRESWSCSSCSPPSLSR